MGRIYRRSERVGATAILALSLVGGGDVAAQRDSTPIPLSSPLAPIKLPGVARGLEMMGGRPAQTAVLLRLGRGQNPPFEGPTDGWGHSGLPLPGLPADAVPAVAPALRSTLTYVPLERAVATRRKPVWRYLVLGAGIGGLSGGLLGWLAGEGMHGGMHHDMVGRHGAHTQTAVAFGIAGGAAFGTLVGLIVYAIDASDTTSP